MTQKIVKKKEPDFLLSDTAFQQGQTLAEVLIAIALLGIILTSMTIVVTTALSNANFSKNQELATQYAQEGMELVKQLQLTNYQKLNGFSGRYCVDQNGVWNLNSSGYSSNCAVNINNFFIRQIDVFPIGSAKSSCIDTIQAAASVLWSDGKCINGAYCHSEQIVSCFSDVNVLPVP